MLQVSAPGGLLGVLDWLVIGIYSGGLILLGLLM
jgi:hypothetical protein